MSARRTIVGSPSGGTGPGQLSARRVVWSLVLLTAVLAGGTVGYVVIEGWSWIDAMYMTVITVGTVGFREIGPLSAAGMIFTTVLIITGIAALGFALGTFVDFLVEGHLLGMLEGRRMTRRIAELSDHHIVVGFGRVGSVVARQLADEGADFVVVDQSADALDTAAAEGWIVVSGDATEEETLLAAGIERAKSLVTALDTDAENLFVTVTARALNPKIFIVSRSTHVSSEDKLLRGGADRVVTPNIIGGRRMASMVLHPIVADYLDLVAHGDGVEFRLQEIALPEGSQFADKTIAQARVRELTGAFILALTRPDGTVDTNPHPDTVLHAGERLVVLGTQDQVKSFVEACAVCSLDGI